MAAEQPAQPHRTMAPRSRLLLVEDDPIQSQVIAARMVAAGYVVETIASGLAAVARARVGRYDVVLIDYRLPEIDGLAVARLIAELRLPPARPVLIALTATPEALNARNGGASPAFDAVVGKSPDMSGLLAAIGHQLTPAQMDRRVAEAALDQAQDDRDDRAASLHGLHGPARILVVEDEAVQRSVLSSVLEWGGYTVDTAADGLEAVHKMHHGHYDLAIIDHNLPGISGQAAGEFITDMLRENDRPILVALTVTPDRVTAAAGPDSVFQAVIAKSSDLTGLIQSVDRLLRASANPATRSAACLTLPMANLAENGISPASPG